VLTEAEYKDFDAKLSACLGQNDCESKQQEIIEEMENGFMLLGVTAVEDKLQDDVPETLADFLKANINVWMLTGDKLETAENIGRSCNLVQNDMKVFYITPETDAAFTLNEVAIHVQSGTK
jgi:magnesium-transporting ATPase (P-type)